MRARSNLNINTQTDRAHCKPWGLDGGLDAAGNQIHVRHDGTWKTDQPNAKMLIARLKPGDAYRLRSGGGGGYGAPYERAVESVRNDVRQGYISVAAARKHYGVIIDPDSLAVEVIATEQLREAMRSGLSKAEPG